jgi:Predicted lipoprotein of unknown function (DUF2380)
VVPDEGMVITDQHHVFPQEERYARWFQERGVDVDDYCIDITPAEHQAQHGGGDWRLGRKEWDEEWNRAVMQFLSNREEVKKALVGPGAKLTRDEIVEAGVVFMKRRGLGELPFRRYKEPAPRSSGTGATDGGSDHGAE